MRGGPDARVARAADAAKAHVQGRAAPKKRAGRLASAEVIMKAATALFLRNGYLGTSMDEIAAKAAVSKQTVYTHFADKERLFSDIVLRITDRAGDPFQARIFALQDTANLEEDLAEFARRYINLVIQPQVLQLRRLLIGEAGRLPKLARAYYEGAPERTLATLAACFQHLGERGRLRVDDPRIAANHFAFLILGMSLDRAMFCGTDKTLAAADLERLADAGVRVFLAAYGQT